LKNYWLDKKAARQGEEKSPAGELIIDNCQSIPNIVSVKGLGKKQLLKGLSTGRFNKRTKGGIILP
jgi:hypothetical protein